MRTRPLLVAAGASAAVAFVASEVAHRLASTRGLDPRRPGTEVGREAILVLGYGNRGPRANAINRYRVRAGLRSMDPRATSSTLILCGGSVMGTEPEARILARYARDELGYRGPLDLEDTSTSTRENIANAIPFLEDADTIRIVSDSVHAAKARPYLRELRPDLAERLARAEEYRVGEVPWMKPTVLVVLLLKRWGWA